MTISHLFVVSRLPIPIRVVTPGMLKQSENSLSSSEAFPLMTPPPA